MILIFHDRFNFNLFCFYIQSPWVWDQFDDREIPVILEVIWIAYLKFQSDLSVFSRVSWTGFGTTLYTPLATQGVSTPLLDLSPISSSWRERFATKCSHRIGTLIPRDGFSRWASPEQESLRALLQLALNSYTLNEKERIKSNSIYQSFYPFE